LVRCPAVCTWCLLHHKTKVVVRPAAPAATHLCEAQQQEPHGRDGEAQQQVLRDVLVAAEVVLVGMDVGGRLHAHTLQDENL
jgi:hypothetical protein